jgi:glycosyltransferase involved in cell wall biosynthesis
MSPAQARTPAVSVVIAAFNADRTIAETLESIAAQTFRDFEVIVVDDGSTDRTAQIAVQMAAGFPKLICLRQPNSGQPAARNRGIGEARGRYVAFVDADDLWRAEKLARQVHFLDCHPRTGLVYADAEFFDAASGRTLCRMSDKCRLYEGDVLGRLLLKSFIPSPTPMVRRTVFGEVGLFDESRELAIGEDWNMWLRIAARHQIGAIRDPLAIVRVHHHSVTQSSTPDAIYESKRRIVEQTVARNPDLLEGIRSRVLAELAHSAGLRHLKLGDKRGARRMFAKAVRERPWNPYSYFCLTSAYLPSVLLTTMNRWRVAS